MSVLQKSTLLGTQIKNQNNRIYHNQQPNFMKKIRNKRIPVPKLITKFNLYTYF